MKSKYKSVPDIYIEKFIKKVREKKLEKKLEMSVGDMVMSRF